MFSNEPFNWQESLTQTYEEFTAQIISFAPQLIGALILLLVGWLVAVALRIGTRKLVRRFDTLFQRVAKTDGIQHEKIKRSYAVILSKIVFWTVMVFFIAAAANMLGWKMFSSWMTSVITYLPNLITGLLIILAGFLLSKVARTGVINTANSTGIEQGEMLARVVQVVILFTTLVIGIEQIGINVGFLTNVLIVAVGVLLAGAALAFGLGAKTLVANIIGAQYVRKHCRIGERMHIGEYDGNIVEVTQTCIILDTGSGRTVVPAKTFQEQASSFNSPDGDVIKSEPPASKSKPPAIKKGG